MLPTVAKQALPGMVRSRSFSICWQPPPNSENCEPPPSTLRPHERGWERPVQDKAKQGWGVLMPLSVTFLPAGSEPSQCGADSTRFNGGSYKNKLDLWASSQNYRISL